MVISKNSWHYKMLTERFFYLKGVKPSNGLCTYFWQVVKRLQMGFLVALAVPSPVVFWLLLVFNPNIDGVLANIFAIIFVVIGAIINGLIVTDGIGSVLLFAGRVIEAAVRSITPLCNLTPSKLTTTVKHKIVDKSNLLVDYIKAKKEKVCPVIEFKGE